MPPASTLSLYLTMVADVINYLGYCFGAPFALDLAAGNDIIAGRHYFCRNARVKA